MTNSDNLSQRCLCPLGVLLFVNPSKRVDALFPLCYYSLRHFMINEQGRINYYSEMTEESAWFNYTG